jgi:uncharacterized protein YggE
MSNLGMVLLGCALVGMASPMALGADGDEGKDREQVETITVTGQGKIGAAPDVAEVSVGVVTEAAAAKDALAQNSDAMAGLHRTIKDFGVASKDVQTTSLNLYPQYSQPRPNRQGLNEPPRIVGYRVENLVRVKCRDISKLGRLLDTLASSGANTIHGINFRIDDDSKLLDEARKRAMADARHTAELLAGEAGAVLGRPIRIREGAAPMPFPVAPMGRVMAAAAPVPVAPGEVETNVTVEVVYRLLPPK